MIYTNVIELVEQQQYNFDTLWHKSIPADEKIKEIEKGIQPQFIEILRDPHEIQKLAFNLERSARDEILILYSTPKAFLRQWRGASFIGGVSPLQVAKEMANKYCKRKGKLEFSLPLMILLNNR